MLLCVVDSAGQFTRCAGAPRIEQMQNGRDGLPRRVEAGYTMPESIDAHCRRALPQRAELRTKLVERLGGEIHQCVRIHLESAVRGSVNVIGDLIAKAIDLPAVSIEKQRPD